MTNSGTAQGPHQYDHDGFARHHHDGDTGDPVWWLNCEQFGGSKAAHRHPGTPQEYGIASGTAQAPVTAAGPTTDAVKPLEPLLTFFADEIAMTLAQGRESVFLRPVDALDILAALRALAATSTTPPAGLPLAVLHPCHVTGMHTPNHHLTSDRVCGIQLEDIAEQMLSGSDPATLPRAVHSKCFWCGTSPYRDGRPFEGADEHRQWAGAEQSK